MTKQESNFNNILKSYVHRKNVLRFKRQHLLRDRVFMRELRTITKSKTPDEQCSFLLQKLRDFNKIIFVDYEGTYELVTNL